ncbi:hypothetical protein C3Y08_00985 [Burkholderia gladioli]|nr:hypothetical protein C3Y08_00985 [Burkholderia gladioli]
MNFIDKPPSLSFFNFWGPRNVRLPLSGRQAAGGRNARKRHGDYRTSQLPLTRLAICGPV